MVTTRPPKTIVKPTALGPVANTDTKLLIYGLFQKGRVLAQDGVQLFAELLRSKRANIEFGYVVHLPWGTKGLDTRESLGLIVESWHALEPVLDMVRGNAESAGR